MIKKEDWVEFFPFDTVRVIQERSINYILETFKTKRFSICELPAGSGKSAIAITVSKYIERHYATENRNASWVLTTQKILQKQYSEDFPWMSNIWSKSNYQCTTRYGVSCQFGLWVNSIFSKKNNNYCDCVYTKDKNDFLKNKISLTNVSFMLSSIEYSSDIEKRNLLIVDECHNIENLITDFVSIDIDKYYLEEYGLQWNNSNDIIDIVDWIKSTILPKFESVKENYLSQIKAIGSDNILNTAEGRNIMKGFDVVDKYTSQLLRSIVRFNKSDWVMGVNKDNDKITLKPIHASEFCEKQLFNIGEKVLLMSGTILDKNTFCENIGVNIKDTGFISLDSPFPIENRPVIFVPTGSMSYKNINTSLPSLAKLVTNLINNEHKNDKGIIHCIEENSNIKIHDGTTKKIKNILNGDIIKTFNEDKKVFENKKVINKFDNGERECIKLKFKNKELICTFDHLILTKNRGWIKAIDLNKKDDVISG